MYSTRFTFIIYKYKNWILIERLSYLRSLSCPLQWNQHILHQSFLIRKGFNFLLKFLVGWPSRFQEKWGHIVRQHFMKIKNSTLHLFRNFSKFSTIVILDFFLNSRREKLFPRIWISHWKNIKFQGWLFKVVKIEQKFQKIFAKWSFLFFEKVVNFLYIHMSLIFFSTLALWLKFEQFCYSTADAGSLRNLHFNVFPK